MTLRRQDRRSLFSLSLTVLSADEQACASPVWQQREGGDNKEHAVRREGVGRQRWRLSEERNCLQYLITKETCSTKWFSPAGVCGTLRFQPRARFSSLHSVNQMCVTHRNTQRNTTEDSWTWFSYEGCKKKTKKQNALSFVDALSRNLLYLL